MSTPERVCVGSAADLPDQIAPEVMVDRLARLQDALGRDQAAFNAATVGRRCTILIERPGRKPGQMIGKSPWLQSVVVENGPPIGTLLDVEITAAGPVSLTGVPVLARAA